MTVFFYIQIVVLAITIIPLVASATKINKKMKEHNKQLTRDKEMLQSLSAIAQEDAALNEMVSLHMRKKIDENPVEWSRRIDRI